MKMQTNNNNHTTPYLIQRLDLNGEARNSSQGESERLITEQLNASTVAYLKLMNVKQ